MPMFSNRIVLVFDIATDVCPYVVTTKEIEDAKVLQIKENTCHNRCYWENNSYLLSVTLHAYKPQRFYMSFELRP